MSKAWPGFADLSRALAARGVPTVCCPGPGEEGATREAAPAALQLGGLGLGAYAALCRRARLTVANDSGPMHPAAAVGAPVLGIFGPGDPARTRPWGPGARWLGGNGAPAARTAAALIHQWGSGKPDTAAILSALKALGTWVPRIRDRGPTETGQPVSATEHINSR
jgi:ADP-heptose:LPS heptosyltransferase